jgi:uncharacterized protein
MNTFTEIYKDRDLYVPAFDLKINGQSLPGNAAKDVIDVRYNDSIDAIDNFEITVNNWDADEQDFKYTGSTRTPPKTGESNRRFDSSRQTTLSPGERSHLFDPGQEIELWMGYFKPPISNTVGQETGLRLMLAGLITKITPNFPASGQPTLKVVGQNALRKFMTVQATHVYEDIKDSDIAEQVGKRGKFKIGNLMIPVRTDKKAKGEEPKNDHVLQDNQYDIVFLLQRAHRNGYDLLLRQETKQGKTEQFLFFGPAAEGQRISYILEWGKSLIQFQPTLTTSRQVYSVTVNGWNAAKGERISITVDRSQLPNRGLRDRKELDQIESGFRERAETIVDRPFRNAAEAKKYALARLVENAKDLVTGGGSTIGTPDLRAGSVVDIRKLGNTFSGKYLVKSTTHTINSGGYITEFTARLEEKN